MIYPERCRASRQRCMIYPQQGGRDGPLGRGARWTGSNVAHPLAASRPAAGWALSHELISKLVSLALRVSSWLASGGEREPTFSPEEFCLWLSERSQVHVGP